MTYTLEEGTKHQQTFTPYIGLMLLILGSGSISYGYTAAIIGTTLGESPFKSDRGDNGAPADMQN